jgi:hypothetical protein
MLQEEVLMRLLLLVAVLLSPLVLSACANQQSGGTRWHDDVCVEC